MSNSCDECGFRNSEVKGGGPISNKGSNWQVEVSEPEDLQRDIIKAETASISIPELDFEVTSGEACSQWPYDAIPRVCTGTQHGRAVFVR